MDFGLEVFEQKNGEKILIKVENLVSSSHDSLNWDLRRNEIHGITGPSGSGKSFFVKILLGLLPYKNGRILDENGKLWDFENCKIGMLFQSNALLNNLTIGENIMFPLIVKFDLNRSLAKIIAKKYMDFVNLPDYSFDYFPLECSGGMQKRAALARTLVLEPKIVFLDEPTVGLDCEVLESYDILLEKLKKTVSVVIITHDIGRLAKLADRISVLMDGRFFTGTFKDLLKSDNMKVRGFLESYVRTVATF